jgi:dihydrofolate reductase
MDKVEAILAIDQNYGLAKNGEIPWKSKTDMHFFRQKTINNVVVMGSKTLASLPKSNPLKDRLNIVLTNKCYSNVKDNVLFFHEKTLIDFINDPIKYTKDNDKYLKPDYKIYIIGGLQIYNLLCKFCSTIWLTKIKANYECDLIFSKELLHGFARNNIEYEDEELEIIKLTN